MRELKFRVWEEREKEYDTWPYILDDSGNLFRNAYGALIECDKKDYIIEQYTGLKDKNGQKIYEGDIVSEEFEYGGDKTKTIWQVRWCDDECAFELHYASGFKVDDCSLVADDEEDYEVIGNIHKQPELLEANDVD